MSEANPAVKSAGKILLRDVRLAFPVLFEPKAVGDSKDLAFSAAFILHPKHPDLPMLRAAIEAVAREKWTKNIDAIMKAMEASDKLCLHDGNKKAEYDGYAGNWFVNARGKTRPTVINVDRSPLTQADGKPYAGCFVNVRLDLWAQDNNYGKRVNASLAGVQFHRDGDAFSGGQPASADDFDDVSAGADANADLA